MKLDTQRCLEVLLLMHMCLVWHMHHSLRMRRCCTCKVDVVCGPQGSTTQPQCHLPALVAAAAGCFHCWADCALAMHTQCMSFAFFSGFYLVNLTLVIVQLHAFSAIHCSGTQGASKLRQSRCAPQRFLKLLCLALHFRLPWPTLHGCPCFNPFHHHQRDCFADCGCFTPWLTLKLIREAASACS